jgi:predicted transcriptional regulator
MWGYRLGMRVSRWVKWGNISARRVKLVTWESTWEMTETSGSVKLENTAEMLD